MATKYSAFSSKLSLHSVLAMVFFAVFVVIFLYYPVLYSYLLTEDSWLEYGSFASLFVASILMAVTIVRDPSYRKPGYFLFSVFLIFIAGEEISWGERLHHIHAPVELISRNLQYESNLHNLPFFQGLINITFVLMVGVWGLALPLLVEKISRLRFLCDRFGIPIPARHHAPYFVMTLCIILIPVFVYRMELAEPIFTLCLLMTTLHITGHADIHWFRHDKDDWKIPTVAWTLTLLLTAALSIGYSNPDNFKYRINTFAASGYPARGLDAQASQLKDYIFAHPELIQ